MSNGWSAEFAHFLKEHSVFTEDRWGMFQNAAGVPYHESLSDLRHFMCHSEQLRSEIRGMLNGAYWNQDQRKSAYQSFCWMMATHAFLWELRGWQFEPDSTEILSWI